MLDLILQSKRCLQACPVVGLVVHAGRVERQMDAADGLCEWIFIICWNSDFSHHAVGGQPALDLLLWRHVNGNIAFNDGLAGERVALLNISRGKADGASAPDRATHHLDGATPTTALPAARLSDVNACDVRGICQQGVGGDGNCSWVIVEGEGDGVLHFVLLSLRGALLLFATKQSPVNGRISA